MLFPRVQNEQLTPTRFPVSALTLTAGKYTEDAAAALKLLLPEISVGDLGLTVRAAEEDTLPAEGYNLRLDAKGIEIRHNGYDGLVRALATLSLLPTKKEGKVWLPEGEITDAPAFPHRGVMLDIGRGAPPIEEMERAVILAAKSRMNVVHLHLSDAKGLGVRLTTLPQGMLLDTAYDRAQINKIVRLCRLLALELIPEFDLPAHSTALLQARPDLHCPVPVSENERLWCVCAGNEDVYTLYAQIIDEICEWFPDGKYFHIGGDELIFIDITPPRHCHWEECPRCRETMQRYGLESGRELYYHLMNRVNKIVKTQGRRTMMWSEQIDCTRPCALSKDILMQFWRVAYPGRGPVEGCSMQRQLELGYTLINSHYPETYVDLEKYMSPETLATWRPDERPECTDEYKQNIKGSEVCLWEWGNAADYPFYSRTTPSSILLMGDKLWYGRKGAYEKECAVAMTRTLLGAATPEGTDVFAAVGSLLPPRKDDQFCYPEGITLDAAALQELYTLLGDEERFAGHESRAAALRSCVKAALEIAKA